MFLFLSTFVTKFWGEKKGNSPHPSITARRPQRRHVAKVEGEVAVISTRVCYPSAELRPGRAAFPVICVLHCAARHGRVREPLPAPRAPAFSAARVCLMHLDRAAVIDACARRAQDLGLL